MRKLMILAVWVLGCFSALAQTTNLPASLGTFEVFRNADLPVTIIMPSGYPITSPEVELWNNGVKLSDSTDVTVSGDTIKFTLTKAQIQPLVKSSYFFVTFSNAYLMGAAINPKIGVGIPSNSARVISLPPSGNIRVTMAGDASTAIQASAAASASAVTAIAARDSANAILASSSAQIQARMKFGTMAQLRSTVETISAYTVIEGTRSGLFRYDPSDVSSTDDGAMVVLQGAKRFKRVSEYVSPLFFGAVGDSLTDDATAVRNAALYASAKKMTLHIDAGYVFTIYTNVNFGCNIDGFGTIKTRSAAALISIAGNLTVRDITITGRHNNVNEGQGLYLQNNPNLTADNVKAYKLSKQGLYFVNAPYAKAINCRVDNTRGEYGDAIYFGNCLNPSAVNNVCTDFQRIGIVFEQNCINWYASGNICKNFYPSAVTQINNGIWAERSKGGTAVNNLIENAGPKGLTISPNTLSTAGKTYTFTVSGNTIIKCGEGFNFAFSEDQILNFDANSIIDCGKPIEIGPCLEANISNSTFAAMDSSISYFSEIIRYVPITTTGKKTRLTVSNCKNYIDSPTVMPINITNITAHKGDLNVINCTIGNWGYTLQAITLEGDINYTNSRADFSPLGNTQRYLSNNINTRFRNSTIRISKTSNLLLQGTKVEFSGCEISSDSVNHIQLGNFGTANLRIEQSKIDQVKLYNIRKNTTVLALVGNDFTEYPSEGIINTAAVSLANLIVKGNNFSSTLTTNAPIQLSNGTTTSSFGVNGYSSALLVTGFIPKYESPVSLSNASTSAPTKSSINTTYGVQKGGTVVTYGSITGGARSYRKITDSTTSDWEEKVWATGVSSILP